MKETITCDYLSSCVLNGHHTLIAGATGSGKSTLLDTIIYNMHQFPNSSLKIAIIDLKRVSLIKWRSSTKLISYANEPLKAKELIKDFVYTMQQRFKKLESEGKTQSTETKLYLIIDEAADLLDTVPDAKSDIIRLMRLGRAVNISLIYATQAPDKKTVPAQIQQNCDALIGLRCRDSIASRQIIGQAGCERLPMFGKALVYTPKQGKVLESNVVLTSDEDIKNILSEV